MKMNSAYEINNILILINLNRVTSNMIQAQKILTSTFTYNEKTLLLLFYSLFMNMQNNGFLKIIKNTPTSSTIIFC